VHRFDLYWLVLEIEKNLLVPLILSAMTMGNMVGVSAYSPRLLLNFTFLKLLQASTFSKLHTIINFDTLGMHRIWTH